MLIDPTGVFEAHSSQNTASNRIVSVPSAMGLSLVYASAYFLPLTTATQVYLLTSLNLFRVVAIPSLVTVIVCFLLILGLSATSRKWVAPRIALGCSVLALSLFGVLALKGVAEAAGYHWQDSIPRGRNLLATQQMFKYGVSSIVLAIVWSQRRSLGRVTRLLTSLGFAFGVLAVIRLVAVSMGHGTALESSMGGLQPKIAPSQLASIPAAGGRTRRVVWVLFDETDFGRVFAPDVGSRIELKNFDFLARASVFATRANSPASATLYSVPALLTGVPLGGKGVRIDRQGRLALERPDGSMVPFGEDTSIFGVLRSRGEQASVLGFLHPYCKIFVLSRCESFIWPEVGTIGAAMTVNVPDGIARRLRGSDYWADITRDQLAQLPSYISGDEALTFVHLNVPHLPAAFADARLNLPPDPNPLTEYDRNLRLSDEILGQIIEGMRAQLDRHELLLIVSTDHWLRNRWYRANEREVSRPIPLIMWKVGDTQGIMLTQPISTVQTSRMILDFLHGDISDQNEVAAWWAHQPTFPSFMAPAT
jgi:hypothetical protein